MPLLSCVLTFSCEPFLAAFFEEASKIGHFSVSLLICGNKHMVDVIITHVTSFNHHMHTQQ